MSTTPTSTQPSPPWSAPRDFLVSRLHEASPASALAVFAHPDDTESACGGTLARWAGNGTRVTVLIACQGEKGSSDLKVDPVALARTRSQEAAEAVTTLGGAELVELGHGDGTVGLEADIRGEVVAAIRRLQPEVVVCPDPTAVLFGRHYVNHRDHREVGWAVLDGASHEAGLPAYWPGSGEPHQPAELWLAGTLEPDVWVDVSKTIAVKAAALACHASQVGETDEWLRTMVERRAEADGRAVGVSHAEGFRRLLLS